MYFQSKHVMKKQKKIKLGKSKNRISIQEQFEKKSYSYGTCYFNIVFRNRHEKSTPVFNCNNGCLVLHGQSRGVQTETTRPTEPNIFTLCPFTEKVRMLTWRIGSAGTAPEWQPTGAVALVRQLPPSWLRGLWGLCSSWPTSDPPVLQAPVDHSRSMLNVHIDWHARVPSLPRLPPTPRLVCWKTACHSNDLPWRPQVSGKLRLTHQPNIGLFEVELSLTRSWLYSDIKLWCFNMGIY